MAVGRWYAVQVETGRERAAAARIRQATEGLVVSREQLAEAQAGRAPMPAAVCVDGLRRGSRRGGEKDFDAAGAPHAIPSDSGVASTFQGAQPNSGTPVCSTPSGHVWLLEECFVPMRLAPVPRHSSPGASAGPSKMEERPLFPGYLVAVSPVPELLSVEVRRSRASARLLGTGDVFVPLSDDEVAWLDRFTHRGHRTVGMSTAYAVPGSCVQVVDGPLVGREALISRVDHRRKAARVRLTMCGREVEVELGLRVLRKRR